MALFKISRGGEKNLPQTITDGWAYFTPDTKGFFIDVQSTINNQNFNERIEINEKDLIFYPVIKSSDLDINNRYLYSLPESYSNINYNLNIELYEEPVGTQIATLFDYKKAAQEAGISGVLSKASQCIIFTCATPPTQTIYLKATLTPKKRTIATFIPVIDGSGGMRPISFYSGSTWREFVELQPDSSSYLFYITSDNQIAVNFEHPYYGYITVTCAVDLDKQIIPNKQYDFQAGCCFVAGTSVLMANNTLTPIENILIGDQVISYNIETLENYVATVANIIINKNSINMAKIKFNNGVILEMTDYHPLYCISGWKSITGYNGYDLMSVGDVVKTIDGWAEIISIEQYQLEEPIYTYTLDVIGPNEEIDRDDNTHDNFYANGVVAHNATSACPN